MPEERFSADLKIVHISDIHVAEPHFLPDLMERVIERVEELQPEIVRCADRRFDGKWLLF